jgi:hypothetical protein
MQKCCDNTKKLLPSFYQLGNRGVDIYRRNVTIATGYNFIHSVCSISLLSLSNPYVLSTCNNM